MSLLATLRTAVARQDGCRPCIHLVDRPMRVEAALPGLSTLSSALASVRADDGLCLAHDRLVNGRRRCHRHHPPVAASENA